MGIAHDVIQLYYPAQKSILPSEKCNARYAKLQHAVVSTEGYQFITFYSL